MTNRPEPRPARRAQLRTGAATLRGGPAAPTGKALSGRILLARRKLGELAGFMHSVVDSMARDGHRVVDAHLVELVPARVFPTGELLVAHGVRPEDGGPPVGLSVALYRLEADGRTLAPVLVEGRPRRLGMHKAGTGALANLFAEAVAAAILRRIDRLRGPPMVAA